ncbi:TcpD family membrane protein [Leuconostoc citreum]|uniref:TcpD family membrane protein n=1 Tax=Leuconostoc citreum TaxID=33964 RepID=UPI0032DEC7D0
MTRHITNFIGQQPIGAISFNGLQSEAGGWAAAIATAVIMYLVVRHFIKGSIGQIIISLAVGGLVYFVVKNPDSALNSVSGIFRTVFN